MSPVISRLQLISRTSLTLTHARVTRVRQECGIVRSSSSVNGVQLGIQKENSDFPLMRECAF